MYNSPKLQKGKAKYFTFHQFQNVSKITVDVCCCLWFWSWYMFLTKLNIFARRLHNMIFYTQHISVKPHTNNIVRNIRKIMLETIMSVKQLNFLLNCILHKTCGLNVKLIRQDIALHVNRKTANINQSNPLSTKLTDKNILYVQILWNGL